MRLVASMVTHNEADRYLEPCLAALAEFVDEIRVWDDGSTDDTLGILSRHPAVQVNGSPESAFFDHEGRVRQLGLDWTLQANPTHVVAVDADELILAGPKLREQLERGDAWSLCMREVWQARPDSLQVRQDGGWCEHPVSIVWRVPRTMNRRWAIADRQLACGRTPITVGSLRAVYSDVAVYHFGWANRGEREARWLRYRDLDGGRFHRNSHIDSIMWPDMDVTATMETVQVPEAWVERANRQIVATGGNA